MPRIWSLRTAFIAWVFYGLIISVIYQGKLSSFLTTPVYGKRIGSHKDINDSDLTVYIQGGFTEFIQSFNFKKMEISNNTIIEDLTLILSHKNKTMVINNLAIVDKHKEIQDPKTFRQRIYTVPELYLISYHSTYYVQKGHPLLKNVSEKLYYVHASGLPSKWLNDYLTMQSKTIYRDVVEPLAMESLQFPGLILFIGFALSCVIFCCEKYISCEVVYLNNTESR